MELARFDPASPTPASDVYVGHLATMETSHGAVIAEDIFNDRGVLLLRKGTALRPDMAVRLQGHVLNKAIDELIIVGKTITAKELCDDCLEHIRQFDDLALLHKQAGFDDGLHHLFFSRALPRIILQHLTVMKQRQPIDYRRSLFCIWLGALIADEMRLSAGDVYSTFIAAMFHDIGLLHVDMSDQKSAGNTPQARQKYYARHVAVARAAVERTGIYDKVVALAVAQHHERYDGTGFPLGMAESQLCVPGQIIAMCEALYELRTVDFAGTPRTLADVIPFLRVNQRTHSLPISQSVYSLLQHSGLQVREMSTSDNQEKLVKRAGDIQRVFTELVSLSDCLAHALDSARAQPLLALTGRVMEVSRSSGLVDEETVKWLRSLRAEEITGCASELAEMTEMQMELLWLVKRAHRKLGEMLAEQLAKNPDIAQKVSPQLAQMDQELRSAWTSLSPMMARRKDGTEQGL